MLLICKLEEIRFAEKPLKRLCGRYSCINGRAKIVLNSQLTPGAKWFALARKLSAHYVSDDDQSDALAAIALLPTWMLYRFSRQQLIAWGYSQDFMNVRSVVMDQYPSLDCSAPADAHLIDFRNSLSEYLNLSP